LWPRKCLKARRLRNTKIVKSVAFPISEDFYGFCSEELPK
jgi:hypothetical protein